MQTWYNVTFFGSAVVTRAWIKTEKIQPFKKSFEKHEFQLSKKHKYKYRMNKAITQALDALEMPLIDRLKKYGCLKQYKKQVKPTKSTEKKNKNKKEKLMSPIDEDSVSEILDNLDISNLSLNFNLF